MKQKYIEWLDNLKRYWINKDIDKILSLFSNDVEYCETPFKKINDIRMVWDEIKEHEIKALDYRIMGFDKNKVIVNFVLHDMSTVIDMVYEIEFNNNKCIKFKQWYMQNK